MNPSAEPQSVDEQSQTSKLQSFGKFALVISLACAALLVVTISAPVANRSSTNLQEDSAFVETKGRQPIKTGCVNLYGSDWAMYPDTRAVVVCNELTSGFLEAQIDNIGFSKDSENHGISYVETGSQATVVLYTDNDYQGASLTVGPNQKVWLEQVSIPGWGNTKWNDKVMSVYFQGHSGALITQITHLDHTDIPVCGDHCVMLYASDPFEHLGPHDTTAVVACGDPLQQKVWKYSYDYIKNQGFPLHLYSLGVSYITVGEQVSLQMFSGPNFDGNTEYLQHSEGKSIDLTTVPYPEVCETCAGWNDKPMSFILTLNDV